MSSNVSSPNPKTAIVRNRPIISLIFFFCFFSYIICRE